MKRRRVGWGLGWVGLLCVLQGGCASGPRTGAPRPPTIYPDRTSAEAAWETFLWAWRAGDVEVLEQVTGWKLHHRLVEQIRVNGREAVADYYRTGAEDLRVEEARWTEEGQALAYLRVVVGSEAVPRAEVDFSFVRRDDGWVLTERRVVR